MNFVKKIFGFQQDKDENTASVSDITSKSNVLSISSDISNCSSSYLDEFNIEKQSEQHFHCDKTFSYQLDCLDDSINNADELVDFEELIDTTRHEDVIKTAQNIKEFEEVLYNCKTLEQSNIKYLENEIDDVLENLHNDNLDAIDLEIPNKCMNNTTSSDCVENINKDNLVANEVINNDSPLTETKEEFVSDIISLISDSDTTMDDDGYNSSDFEFITENDAKIIGDTFKIKNYSSKTRDKDVHVRNDFKDLKSENNAQPINSYNRNNLSLIGGFDIDPGEGPSNSNRPMNDHSNREYRNYHLIPGENPSNLNGSIDYSNREYRNNCTFPGEGSNSSSLDGPMEDYSNREYRDNHIVPEGDDYLDLFQNNPVMSLSQIIFLENKSIRPLRMNNQYEGIGFDAQLIGRAYELDSSEEEYEEEANESIERIKLLYPGENRSIKRRRY